MKLSSVLLFGVCAFAAVCNSAPVKTAGDVDAPQNEESPKLSEQAIMESLMHAIDARERANEGPLYAAAASDAEAEATALKTPSRSPSLFQRTLAMESVANYMATLHALDARLLRHRLAQAIGAGQVTDEDSAELWIYEYARARYWFHANPELGEKLAKQRTKLNPSPKSQRPTWVPIY